MAKQFIEEKFWNKTVLSSGTHNVEITCIEFGKNISTRTPFIICIFENENGYFPKKINLKMESEQNYKFVKNLYEAAGIEEPIKVVDNYKNLLNKKLNVLISLKVGKFGSGLNVNSFTKYEQTSKYVRHI